MLSGVAFEDIGNARRQASRNVAGVRRPADIRRGLRPGDVLDVGWPPSRAGSRGECPGSREKLPPPGRRIDKLFGGPRLGSGGPAYAAQAAAVLLDAIAASDGTRRSVNAHLLSARVRNGIVGSFSFDRNGDPSFNPTMVFRIHNGKGKLDRVIVPPADLIP